MERLDNMAGADEFDIKRSDIITVSRVMSSSPEQIPPEPRKLYNTTGTPAKDGIQQFSAPRRVQRELSNLRRVLPPGAALDSYYSQYSSFGASSGHVEGFALSPPRPSRLEERLLTLRIQDAENAERAQSASYSSMSQYNSYDPQSRSYSSQHQGPMDLTQDRHQSFNFTAPQLEMRSGNVPRQNSFQFNSAAMPMESMEGASQYNDFMPGSAFTGQNSVPSSSTSTHIFEHQNSGLNASSDANNQPNQFLPGSALGGVNKFATMQSLSKLPNATGDAWKQFLENNYSAAEMRGRYPQSSEPAQQTQQRFDSDSSMAGPPCRNGLGQQTGGQYVAENSNPLHSSHSHMQNGTQPNYPPGFPRPLTAGPPGQRQAPIGSGRLSGTTAASSLFNDSRASTAVPQPLLCEDNPNSIWYKGRFTPYDLTGPFQSLGNGELKGISHIVDTASIEDMKKYYPNGFPKGFVQRQSREMPVAEHARNVLSDEDFEMYTLEIHAEAVNKQWLFNVAKMDKAIGGDIAKDTVASKHPTAFQRPYSNWLDDRRALMSEEVVEMSGTDVEGAFEPIITHIAKHLPLNGQPVDVERLSNNYVPSPASAIDSSEGGNKSYFSTPAVLYPGYQQGYTAETIRAAIPASGIAVKDIMDLFDSKLKPPSDTGRDADRKRLLSMIKANSDFDTKRNVLIPKGSAATITAAATSLGSNLAGLSKRAAQRARRL